MRVLAAWRERLDEYGQTPLPREWRVGLVLETSFDALVYQLRRAVGFKIQHEDWPGRERFGLAERTWNGAP